MERKDVAHLLRRATLGPTAAEVDAAERAGFEATLAGLLNPTGRDAGAAATPLPDLGEDAYAQLGQGSSKEEKQAAKQHAKEQITQLIKWWTARMVAAEHQWPEKLVFFWHGHWATSVQKVKSATLMSRQLETFRALGAGDFQVFTQAMLRDAALIFWLDGQQNTRKAPNENLARELMELFTLGVGNYTEDDIKAGARVLTGWMVDRRTGTVTLNPQRHDEGPVALLGGRPVSDVDGYAALLCGLPANGEFLASRMWYRFASGEPLADDVKQRLASAYRVRRNITDLARAVFTDPAFPATRGQLVKQPVEWLLGALRQLGIGPAQLGDDIGKQLLGGLKGLGQTPLAPPSVGGWPAGAGWLTTASTQVRMRLAAAIAPRVPQSTLDKLAGVAADQRLDALARLLVVDQWTDRSAQALKAVAADPVRLIGVGLVSPEYTMC